MMRKDNTLLKVGTIAVIILLAMVPVFGQNIHVTLRLNTSTNPDTLMAHHYADVRGECTGANVPGITWDNTTGIVMQNVGGDYWETTFEMAPEDTLRFKFWTGFDNSANTSYNWGWEGSINPADALGGDSRSFISGNQDTTLALQFYHGSDVVRDQYWRPWEVKADSFVVYFRVNMGAFIETGDFDPAVDSLVVMGGAPLDPDDAWDDKVVLTREAGSADGEAFFSGAGYVAKASVAGGEWQNFKYVYIKNGSEVWESTSNRYFQLSGPVDTTLAWVYFNNQKPSGGNIVQATLTWQMKTDGLEKLGLFNRSLGETIVIDGAKAWASDMADAIQMTYVPLLQLWMGQEPFTKAPGATLEYKAVVLWDDSRIDSTSENYLPGLALDFTSPVQYWEEPITTGSGNRNYSFTGETEQAIPGDYGFDWQYFGGLPAEGVLETPITVTFNVDMTPATDVETNPSNTLFRPGVDTVSIQFYGCLLPLTQGDAIYANTPWMLTDPDGDLIYSGTFDLVAPVSFDAGYRVNYTSDDGTIQNGGGFTRGRSYYQFIQPTAVNSDGTVEWPAEYTFPVVQWKDSDLPAEDPPDLWTPTSVDPKEAQANSFHLTQNYPNPFNPLTMIQYQVPKAAHVRLNVYNVAGQLISTLVNEVQPAGSHLISWDASHAASGVYFVEMVSGSYKQIKKMTLLK